MKEKELLSKLNLELILFNLLKLLTYKESIIKDEEIKDSINIIKDNIKLILKCNTDGTYNIDNVSLVNETYLDIACEINVLQINNINLFNLDELLERYMKIYLYNDTLGFCYNEDNKLIDKAYQKINKLLNNKNKMEVL